MLKSAAFIALLLAALAVGQSWANRENAKLCASAPDPAACESRLELIFAGIID